MTRKRERERLEKERDYKMRQIETRERESNEKKKTLDTMSSNKYQTMWHLKILKHFLSIYHVFVHEMELPTHIQKYYCLNDRPEPKLSAECGAYYQLITSSTRILFWFILIFFCQKITSNLHSIWIVKYAFTEKFLASFTVYKKKIFF